jgi:hypothetical protein
MIESTYPQIPLERQCELLGLARSTYYYQPRPPSELNLVLMRLIDEQYTKTPFYGVPRMTLWLNKQGYLINHKRVARLMRLMGLQAVYPKRKMSIPSKQHKIYPYLLRGITVERPDQVWAADITYIRMLRGFIYLVAVMDWFSRYVLAWEVSITMEKDFCISALDRALIFPTRRSSIPIRVANLPVQILLDALRATVLLSAWMAEVGYSTIFSLSDCGGLSSTRRYIYTTTKTSERPGRAFHSTSVFIIQSVFIPLWGITHLRRSMFKEERHSEITMDFSDYAPNT